MAKEIVSLLEEFGSPDYQRRQWVNAEDPNQIAFYVESLEVLYGYDFMGIAEVMRRKEMISASQVDTVLKFDAALSAFAEIERSEGIDPYNDAAIISHSCWSSVVESAIQAIPVFSTFRDSELVLPTRYDIVD